MKNTITVRLPKELAASIEYVAKQKGIGVSDIVRESVSRYVVTQRLELLREKILPRALKAGIVTDEDAFKAVRRL
jgi:hypothetical protein